MRAAYDALDDGDQGQDREALAPIIRCTTASPSSATQTKKADGEYSGYGFHDGPVPLRPLVKTHPETGRKSLLIGRHAHNIPGMDKAESERLLEELVDLRLPAAAHLASRLAAGRRGGVGQSLPAAPGDALGHDPARASCGTAASPAIRRARLRSPPELDL